jgi:hypothetical protein
VAEKPMTRDKKEIGEKSTRPAPLIRFSGATFGGPAGKVISRDKTGGIKKNRLNRHDGVAFCKEMIWPEYVADRKAATPNTLYNSGNYSDPDRLNGMAVTTKPRADGIFSVAMSNDYLEHVPGVAAIARIDVDYKDPKKVHAVCPEKLKLPDTPEGLEEQFLELIPGLEGCAYMIMDSSSGMLSTAEDERLTGASGYRIEIPIADGSRIPTFMKTVHETCWAMNYGWSWVDNAGNIQERSLVDLALKSPHQPDYAAAELRDGIKQNRRVLIRHGKFFDPDTITPLTEAEKAEADAAKAEARAALDPIAKQIKAKVRDRDVKKLVKRGVDEKRARKIVGHLHEAGILSGEMEVQFGSKTIAVADLILDGEGRDEAVCLDPLEPDYASDKPVAIFYWNGGLNPGIFTKAHGGKFYHLRFDKVGLLKVIEDGLDNDNFARCVALSKLSGIDETQIIIAATKALGLGNRTKALTKKVNELKAGAKQDAGNGSSASNVAWVDEMNERYAVINDGGTAVVFRVAYDNALNRKLIERLKPEAIKTLHDNQTVEAGTDAMGNPVYAGKGSAWLKKEERREYLEGVVLSVHGNAPDGHYNLWRGWGVEPGEGDWSLMQTHMRDVLCDGDEESFEYLLNWCARMVQKPDRQGEVAIVLRGEKGTGKGTLGNALGALFGGHYLYLSKSEQLTGRFNAHLRDSIFIFADEAFFAGDRKHEGSLKSIITEPVITIEAKFGAIVTAPNYGHLFMATNSDWAIPASSDERRYAVFNVSSERLQDFPYFKAIKEEMEAGGLGAMLHDLLNHNIKGFNVRAVPKTEGLRDQKLLTLRGVDAWLYDCLQKGEIPAQPNSWADEKIWDDSGVSFNKTDAYGYLVSNARRYRCERDIPNDSWWSRRIRDVVGASDQRIKMKRHLVLGPLDECRAKFEVHIGHAVDWEIPESLPEQYVETESSFPRVKSAANA